jgi:beta-galactosidase
MQKICFDRNWFVSPYGDWWDKKTRMPVDLPHDASISQDRLPDAVSGPGGGFFPGLNLVYEKTFASDPGWTGRQVWLTFEGVYQMAEVRINGRLAGRQHYGYTTFHVDATPFLRSQGENQVKVQVCNGAQPNSRWYSGSGIYRHVWLVVLEPADIELGDLFVYTELLSEQSAVVAVRATVTRRGGSAAELPIKAELLDPQGGRAGEVIQVLPAGDTPNSRQDLAFNLSVANPACWSVDQPSLYCLKLSAFADNQWTLLQETTYGIRQLELSPQDGLKLNGRPLKLRGGCIHHDHGPLGAASFDRAEERKVLLLKAAGYNAVRCAHNPPAPAFLDACDRHGLLVMDEIFDCWQEGKNPFDYHTVFDRDWEKDLTAMIRRDRNHPSVIIWSTGNEIPERDGRSQGYAWSERLAAKCRSLDPTRPVTNALNGLSAIAVELNNLEANLIANRADDDYWGWKTADFVKPLDIVGYNYMLKRYADDAVKFPGRIICGAESFPLETAAIWQTIDQMPQVVGDFVWTAIDYLGEAGLGHVWYDGGKAFLGSHPWHQANCGDYDICGFARPQLALRKQVWGLTGKPYLAVLRPDRNQDRADVSAWGWPEVIPFWDWTEYAGQQVQVVVYGDAPEIRLNCNGHLIGSQACGIESGYQCAFSLPYEPGVLTASAYDGDQLLGEQSLVTPGPACTLRLETDRERLVAGETPDLAYVTIEVVDAAGQRVRTPGRELHVTVAGQGHLQVLGSSNPCADEPYRGNHRQSFEGRLLAIVRTGDQPGEIILTAMAEGLQPAAVQLVSG